MNQPIHHSLEQLQQAAGGLRLGIKGGVATNGQWFARAASDVPEQGTISARGIQTIISVLDDCQRHVDRVGDRLVSTLRYRAVTVNNDGSDGDFGIALNIKSIRCK